MRRKGSGSVGVWSVLGKLGLLLLLAIAAFDGSGFAVAQDDEVPPADDQIIRGEHVPFTPWSDEPGAIPFEALPLAEQDAVMRQAEWAETNAYEITQAWSGYTHRAAAAADAQRAAHLAGLSGTEEIGVAP